MKNIAVLLITLVFSFYLLFSGKAVRAVNTGDTNISPVSSYELFWPIVSGKVMGDKMYSLKIAKEKLREALIFGNSKKANYNIMLSEKRLVEAEKLLVDGKKEEAQKTFTIATQKRQKVMSNIEKTKAAGLSIDTLKGDFVKSLEKQELLLNYLMTIPNSKEVGAVKDSLADVESLLSQLQ